MRMQNLRGKEVNVAIMFAMPYRHVGTFCSDDVSHPHIALLRFFSFELRLHEMQTQIINIFEARITERYTKTPCMPPQGCNKPYLILKGPSHPRGGHLKRNLVWQKERVR